ncbi:MAG: sodium:solute symporter family protein [Bacteroidia bacterium]|nr:sodium:solute symporter family protein [Bacteroidia bacterium]
MSNLYLNRTRILWVAVILCAGVGGITWFRPDFNWLGLVVIMVFYLMIFAVGLWAGKEKPGDNPDSFLLAGRKLPLWVGIMTMAATWIDGGYINGTAEYASQNGLVWVQAPWGYAVSLILGGLFFARKMRRFQFRTMLDPLSQRYGKRATALFFLPAVSGEIFWTAAILTALGTTFSIILDLGLEASIIVSAAVAVTYTTLGGLRSVAYTDVLQLCMLTLGLFVVLPVVLTHAGGITTLWETYSARYGAAASLFPSRSALGNYYWNWWDTALLLMLGGIPWQVYFQRVLATRSENAAMWLSILAGIICLVVAVPAALIGMVGGTTDWAALGLPGPETTAGTLPYVFRHLTSPVMALIGLATVAAAVMSSIDSSMLSASSLAAWNVWRPLVKPDLSEVELKKIVQRSILIVGTAATLLALKVDSVYALWALCSDFVYCLLFPALACAMFDPKANTPGAVAGFAVAAVFRFGGGDVTLGLPAILPYPMIEDGVVLFPFRTFAMVSGLITIIVVSRLTQKKYPARSCEPVSGKLSVS